MSHTNDKRRHPRHAHRVRVRSHEHGAVEFETIDLSAGGFSCTAPAFLPLMTKLAISLVLPTGRAQAGAGEKNGHETVRGEAVVVRSEPATPVDGKESYRVALFFSRMEDDDRKRLHDFLARQSSAKSAH